VTAPQKPPRSGAKPEHVLDEAASLTEAEEEKVVERLALRAPAVYALVKEEGEAELARPVKSLFWSGIAAGIAMGFSVLTLALLEHYLPDAGWTPLIASFGYAAGFLLVILGRLQLFTESTIKAVLPMLAKHSWASLWGLLRIWGVVLSGNWIGCVLVAFFLVQAPLVPAPAPEAVVEASRHYLGMHAGEAFAYGIGAGFLVAGMVWAMPSAESSRFALISFTAWLIALGGFTHVVAGFIELSVLVLRRELGPLEGLLGLALPTLAGNVLGGTGLFALLAHAQVTQEVHEAGD
jgi:formate/nitrite transporter FocA (FNT family)